MSHSQSVYPEQTWAIPVLLSKNLLFSISVNHIRKYATEKRKKIKWNYIFSIVRYHCNQLKLWIEHFNLQRTCSYVFSILNIFFKVTCSTSWTTSFKLRVQHLEQRLFKLRVQHLEQLLLSSVFSILNNIYLNYVCSILNNLFYVTCAASWTTYFMLRVQHLEQLLLSYVFSILNNFYLNFVCSILNNFFYVTCSKSWTTSI